jgi:hypothetical protein
MKRITAVLPLIILFGLTNLHSQFTVTPNSHDVSLSDIDLSNYEDFLFESFMTNLTSETLLINWEVLEANHPEEWIVVVSDLQISYILSTVIDFNDGIPSQPLVFTPNLENALFNLIFNPRMVAGCGDVSIKVFNTETNEIYDTLTYNISINTEDCSLVSTSDIFESENQIKVYPSPTEDFITLEGITQLSNVEISNSSGQLVFNTAVAKNGTIDISHFQSGIYFLRIVNDRDKLEIHKVVKN